MGNILPKIVYVQTGKRVSAKRLFAIRFADKAFLEAVVLTVVAVLIVVTVILIIVAVVLVVFVVLIVLVIAVILVVLIILVVAVVHYKVTLLKA